MSNDTILTLSYGKLRELMEMMQNDGLSADGCVYSLSLDTDKEIQDEIELGTIKVVAESEDKE